MNSAAAAFARRMIRKRLPRYSLVTDSIRTSQLRSAFKQVPGVLRRATV